MIYIWFLGLVSIRIVVVLEVAFLSVPEVGADKVWESSCLNVENLLHLRCFSLVQRPAVDEIKLTHSLGLMSAGKIFRLSKVLTTASIRS